MKFARSPAGAARRKREPLLLKPPSPPTEPRDADDDDNDDGPDDHYSGNKFHHVGARKSAPADGPPEQRRARLQSTENLTARRAGRHSPSSAAKPNTTIEFAVGSDTRAHIKTTTSVSPPRGQSRATEGRRKFGDFRQFLDFSRRPPAGLMMVSGCHSDKGHQRPDRAAAQMSRRKSELTSFLTILFGSMLAVLLLAGGQIMCGQPAGQAGPAALNRSRVASRMGADASDSAGATAALSTSGPPVPTASSSVTPPADGKDYDDYEDAADSDKPKLAAVMSETAHDGTDLLMRHLQRPGDSADARADGDEDSDERVDADKAEADQPQPREEARNVSAAGARVGTAQPLRHGAQAESDDAEQMKFAMETYAKWRAASDDLIELFSRKLMPVIIEHGYDVDAGTVAGLLQAFNGVRQLRPWALKLLDAWTKISPGILLGTQSDFGDFDECLNIRVDDPNGLAAANSEHFPSSELDPLTGLPSTTLVGRYCLADVEFPKPPRRRASNASMSPTWPYEPIELRKPLLDFAQLPAFKDTIFVETGNFFHMLYVDPIRVGICITNKIDPHSFQQVFNKLLEEFRVTINFRGRCVTKFDRPTWTSYQKVSAYVLVVACSLVLLSTGLDLFMKKLNKLPCPPSWTSGRLRLQIAAFRHRDLITSFSLIRNTRRLFKPSAEPRPARAALGHHRHQAAAAAAEANLSCAGSSSLATTSSSLADSSVESSPSIERRSSSDTSCSIRDLIAGHRGGQSPGGTGPPKSAACCYDGPAPAAKCSGREPPSAQVSLLSLHGIRVLTMVWMIVNHTYMFGGFFVLWAHRRLIDIAEWPKSLSFQMVLNGWLTVETYFFLSAMIIVLNVLPLMRAAKFNYALYVLHRLVRLLPAYVGLVCLNFLWPLVSSGPVWLVKGRSFVQEPCEQYLWTNFLFMNNWIWPEKQCMVHTWFLSADFQLYLLAPIIVYLLYRRPALGHALNLLVALAAGALSGFVIYANKLLPTTLINKLEFDAIKQQLSYSYFATYQHMGPYCLGLLVGYLLHKQPHARLPKHLTWLLWLLLPPLSFTTLLLTYLWNGAYSEPSLVNPSPLVSALYVAIHRTIWTSLVAWLVFACATGRAKLLASFLSHAIFLPVSRLSYSIYLVHLPVIMFRALNLRHTVEWTDQNILWEACGNFVVSSLLGFFLNVAFESPMINLENVISGRGRADRGAISGPKQQGKLGESIFDKAGLTVGHPDKQAEGCAPMSRRQGSFSTGADASSDKDHSMASPESSPVSSGSAMPRKPPLRQLDQRALQMARASRPLGANGKAANQRRPDQPQQDRGVAELAGRNFGQARTISSCSDNSLPRGGAENSPGTDNPEDDLYDVSADYRHYMPSSGQQWRRATDRLDSAHGQAPPASSNSMRSMQYATLARTNRVRQELSFDGRAQQRLERVYQQRYASVLPPTYDHQLGAQERALPDASAQLDYNPPFEIGRLTLMQQRQLLASRRRQGRYNTLTGTGARDWRSQLQARQYPQPNPVGATDPPAWEHYQQPAVWSGGASEPAQTSLADGGLLIPRVDLSSTLRRQARNTAAMVAPAHKSGGAGDGSQLGGAQEQPSGNKIEEEPTVEPNETSAL